MSATLLQGDALAVLATLPAGSVQTCVTSPPYYGLRDYGTAAWEGGDPGCDHRANSSPRSTRPLGLFHGGDDRFVETPYRDTCGKCGAVRIDAQIGLEETPEAYVAKLVAVFREVRRVLADDGCIWVNIGDSYAANRGNGASSIGEKQATNVGANLGRLICPPGYKPKDLIGIPWMLAFALRADGWYLRSEIIWHKPNPMPESVTDRPTKSHEQIFLLSKRATYYYDADAIREPHEYPDATRTRGECAPGSLQENLGKYWKTPNGNHPNGRNRRSVWTVATQPYAEAHFATFPPKLIEPCILAGSREGDTVLDPFSGSGTTGEVALIHHRNYIGIELNPDYVRLSEKRLAELQPTLFALPARSNGKHA